MCQIPQKQLARKNQLLVQNKQLKDVLYLKRVFVMWLIINVSWNLAHKQILQLIQLVLVVNLSVQLVLSHVLEVVKLEVHAILMLQQDNVNIIQQGVNVIGMLLLKLVLIKNVKIMKLHLLILQVNVRKKVVWSNQVVQDVKIEEHVVHIKRHNVQLIH